MPWDRAELRVGRLEDGDRRGVDDRGAGGVRRHPVAAAAGVGRRRRPALRRRPDRAVEPLAPAPGRPTCTTSRSRRPTPTPAARSGCSGPRWFAPLRRRADRRRAHERRRRARRDRARPGDVRTLPLDADRERRRSRTSAGTRVLVSGAGSRRLAGLWLVDVDDPGATRLIAGGGSPWGAEWMPQPRAVTFAGPHGPVHAFDYPPTNPDVTAPDDELPPYVVFVHGGPTDACRRARHPARSRTSRAAASACSTSTTAARPGTGAPTASACSGSGASSTSTTSSPPRSGLAAVGARRRRAARDRRRLGRRLDGAVRPRGLRRLRRGHQPLRRRGSPAPRRGHARLRGAATSTAWSGRSRRPRSCTSSGRR